MSMPSRLQRSVMLTGPESWDEANSCRMNMSTCSIMVDSKPRIALSEMACPTNLRFTLCLCLSMTLKMLGPPAATVRL